MFKHKEIVKAWLDGKQIQYLSYEGIWKDRTETVYKATHMPAFAEIVTYRIKPESVKLTYRKLWTKRSNGTLHLDVVSLDVRDTKESVEKSMQEWGNFVKWEGDWIEEQYEVPDEASSPKG